MKVRNRQDNDMDGQSVPPALRESRYLLPCPACDGMIHPSQVRFGAAKFPCPFCGARLRCVNLHRRMIWVASILGSGVIFHLCGKGGWDLIALALFGSLALFLVFQFAVDILFPNAARLERVPPEHPVVPDRSRFISLNLRDKPPR